MLISLTIRDVVLIERLTLEFRPGLGVLTGETGAGKSILLDALGLALGARADSALVRRGAPQALVSAVFDLAPEHPANALLREQDIETAETLTVRRIITADGRSRAYVNDQAIGVSLLRRIGDELVEVHGQFETHGLLDPRTHRGLLDAQAGLVTVAAQLASAHRTWRQVEDARRRTEDEITRARAEEDWLRHAVSELEDLAPRAGEEEELSSQRAVLAYREKLLEAVNAARGDLMGDRGAERLVNSALRHLTRVAERAQGALDGAIAALDRASAELAETALQLRDGVAHLDSDPNALEKLEERLFDLRAAARKHGVDVTQLSVLAADFARRLSLIEDQGDELARLTRQAETARTHYVDAAKALSKARHGAASTLDQAVAVELPPLKLQRARFVTEVAVLPETEWGPGGIDRVSFLVATNPGAAPGPLHKIASGGELARFTLALKVVLARAGTIPTLIFDEVDTGIGGAVAAAVGERLARLGREVQVLVVTHSPQVAARGSHHFRVSKDERGGQVLTEVLPLTDDERQEEIARMLSGSAITPEARAAAVALLEGRV